MLLYLFPFSFVATVLIDDEIKRKKLKFMKIVDEKLPPVFQAKQDVS